MVADEANLAVADAAERGPVVFRLVFIGQKVFRRKEVGRHDANGGNAGRFLQKVATRRLATIHGTTPGKEGWLVGFGIALARSRSRPAIREQIIVCGGATVRAVATAALLGIRARWVKRTRSLVRRGNARIGQANADVSAVNTGELAQSERQVAGPNACLASSLRYRVAK